MKGFFYFRMNMDDPELVGVRKKIVQILKAFRDSGVETDVAFFTNRGLEFNGELLLEFSENYLRRGWQKNADAHKVLIEKIDFGKYDFAWMRVGLVLPWVFRFIKKSKLKNPKLKIFLEFGTYPFGAELEGFFKTLYPVSEFYLKRLQGEVFRIITFCGQDEIHRIPCVKMRNGIDVEDYKQRREPPDFSDVFEMIAVSSLHDWHAYERLIAGMKNYYERDFETKKINLVFHIVGAGDKKELLEKAAAENNLREKVIFHGFLDGQKLDEVFGRSHIAVGTLGMHRIQTEIVSSLKNREYCARAIPFVVATIDLDFPEDLSFVKYVAGDDSAIDIVSLIEFYEAAKSGENMSGVMRKYALENLDWKSKISEVFDLAESA